MESIRIIHLEHRSLTVVLHGMLYRVRDLRFCGPEPDFDVLRAMVRYIDTFTERFHHPKEDAYLFTRLALRYAGAVPLIDRLAAEHRTGLEKIHALEQALDRYQAGGTAGFAEFATAAQAYAMFHWDHMRAEEALLLPLARQHLVAEDWEHIDAAFGGHSDPLFSVQADVEFKDLFRKIVELAPPPHGRGRA